MSPPMSARIALLAVALFAAPAAALVPPLPVAVIVVERPGAPAGAAAKMQRLSALLEAEGEYAPDRSYVATKRVQACGRATLFDLCIRRQLSRPTDRPLPVHVAVVVERGGRGQVRLTCIGPGRHPRHPGVQTAWVNLDAALAEPRYGPYRSRANGCIMAAVAERGF